MTRIVPRAMPPSSKSSVIFRVTPPMPAMMPGGQADQVDRVAEVDAVLDPDLGAHQADHAVEHDGDPAEHAARGGVDDRAELRAQAEQDRHQRGDVVGRRGVDPGGAHDADVLGVRRGRRAAERAGERGGEAVGADGPAHVGVEVVAGHLGDRLDVSGVLGDQRDHTGQDEQDEREREARAVHDRDAVGEVAAREADPVGLASTPAQAHAGRGTTGRSRPLGSTEVIWPEDAVEEPGHQVAEDQRQEDRDARPEAREQHGGEHHERRGQQRDPLVLGPVDAGDDRRQVEADQHDDRAGDGGRQDLVDHAGNRRSGRARRPAASTMPADHDRAGDVGGVTALRADRRDAGDERGAGAEVAGHPVVADQQEQDRADSREHDGEVGVEPHHQREDEGGAEHGDHVLGAEPDGLAPRESLPRARPTRRGLGRLRPT